MSLELDLRDVYKRQGMGLPADCPRLVKEISNNAAAFFASS